MKIEHRALMINSDAEPCDCAMCIEIRRRDEAIRLMLAAFRTIATLGGNLPDERLTDRTGPNDAAHRGLMYCVPLAKLREPRSMAHWRTYSRRQISRARIRPLPPEAEAIATPAQGSSHREFVA